MRALWLLAKKRNIPIFFYDEQKNWLLQKKPIPLHVKQLKADEPAGSIIDIAKDKKNYFSAVPKDQWYMSKRRKNRLADWYQLIFLPVQNRNKLSKRSKELIGRLWNIGESLRIFVSDVQGEKTTGRTKELITFMKKEWH